MSRFLAKHTAQETESVWWGDMPLRIAAYLTRELPPLEYVTSVRAIVYRNDTVLVFHDGSESHVLPGGRREPGESVEETLHREVLEETGYTLDDASLLGFLYFRHLGPKPEGYAYPYPDFLQPVFVAQAGKYLPDWVVDDPYVKHSALVPVKDAIALPLTAGERLYLRAALDRRS